MNRKVYFAVSEAISKAKTKKELAELEPLIDKLPDGQQKDDLCRSYVFKKQSLWR